MANRSSVALGADGFEIADDSPDLGSLGGDGFEVVDEAPAAASSRQPPPTATSRRTAIDFIRGEMFGSTRDEEAAGINQTGVVSSLMETIGAEAMTADQAKRLPGNIAESVRAGLGTTIATTKEAAAAAAAGSLERVSGRIQAAENGVMASNPEYARLEVERMQAKAKALREAEATEAKIAVEGRIAQDEAMPRDAGSIEKAIQSGLSSAAQTIPLLALGGPVGGTVMMGGQTGINRRSEVKRSLLERAAQIRKLGGPDAEAMAQKMEAEAEGKASKSGALLGGIEMLTEYLPSITLAKNIPGFWKHVAEFMASELPGENIATLAQLVDDYSLGLRNDLTLDDVLQASRETTLATVAGGGAQVGAAKLLQRIGALANKKAQDRAAGAPPPDAPPGAPPPPEPPPITPTDTSADEAFGAVQPEVAPETAPAPPEAAAPPVEPVAPVVEPVAEVAPEIVPEPVPAETAPVSTEAAPPSTQPEAQAPQPELPTEVPAGTDAIETATAADIQVADDPSADLESVFDEAASIVAAEQPAATNSGEFRIDSVTGGKRRAWSNRGVAGIDALVPHVETRNREGKPGILYATTDGLVSGEEINAIGDSADVFSTSDQAVSDRVAALLEKLSDPETSDADYFETRKALKLLVVSQKNAAAEVAIEQPSAPAPAVEQLPDAKAAQPEAVPAKRGKQPVDLASLDADTVRELEGLGKTAGWAQEGGKAAISTDVFEPLDYTETQRMQEQQRRSSWIPKEPWFKDLAVKLKGEDKDYEGLVRRAIAGEPLNTNERAVIEGMVEIAQRMRDETRAAIEAEAAGLRKEIQADPDFLDDTDAQDAGAVEFAALIELASKYDENAAMAAAERDDDATAKTELNRIIEEGRRRERKQVSQGPAPVQEAQGEEGQAEELTLTAQTPEEIRAAEQKRKADAKAEADARTAAEQKAQADSEAKDFRLSGSNRPADVATAGGQASMFSASGKPAAPAPDADTEELFDYINEAGSSNATLIPKKFVVGTAVSKEGIDGKASIEKFEAELTARGWVKSGVDWVRGNKALFLRGQGKLSSPIVQWNEVAPPAATKKDIDTAANAAATSPKNDLPLPSLAQREAENYRAGEPIALHGYTIRIENPRGSVRHNFDAAGILALDGLPGVDAAAVETASDHYEQGSISQALRAAQRAAPDATRGWWATKMQAHYGRILGTTGRDGDHVDVFLGPHAHDESRTVLVIDQNHPNGRFDEHKVMLGFDNEEAALAQFEGREDFIGAVTPMTPAQFRTWLDSEDHTRRAAEWVRNDGVQNVKVTPAEVDAAFNVAIKDAEPRAIPAKLEADNESAARLIREAAQLGVSGADKALTGLAKLFGGPGTLRSFPGGFDEKTYAEAKPHFEAALKDFQKAGLKLVDFFKFLVRHFGEQIKPYALRFAKEQGLTRDSLGGSDVLGSIVNAQPDSSTGAPAAPVGPAAVLPPGGRQDRPAGQPGEGASAFGSPAASGNELRGSRPAAGGKRSDQPIFNAAGEFGSPVDPPGGNDRAGGREARGSRATNDTDPAPTIDAFADEAGPKLSFAEAIEKQFKAERIPVIPNDPQNITDTLPILKPSQREDVAIGERRLTKPDGYGMLYANGTGTGKTYVGLGLIKRMVKQGKKNGLIVVPSQQIANDWIATARNLGLSIHLLDDTKDRGKGVSITTYANLGENRTLADRDYDFVLSDEAHTLMQNESAAETQALRVFRALTMHPDGAYERAKMKRRKEWEKFERLNDVAREKRVSIDSLPGGREAYLEWVTAEALTREEVRQSQGAKRTRAIFLSATPFAYEKNTAWGEGYLFDFPKNERTGYNQADGFDLFMVQNFGWRMRTGKLTEPGPEVDRGIMQRAFTENLKKSGAMTYRVLEVDRDYDRRFISIESMVGRKIDEGLDYLRTNEQMRPLYDVISKRFDFVSRQRLLEGLKARELVPYIRAQLELGRQVVVFHDFIEGGSSRVFSVEELLGNGQEITYSPNGKPVTVKLGDLAARFARERPDLVELDTTTNSPLVELRKSFPDMLEYNGTVPGKKKIQNVAMFQDDNAERANLIVAQAAANAGWSAHDTTGKHPRVLLNLGMPTAPVRAIQQEGRVYRVGQESDAMFRYANTGTSWERRAFAEKIAERASAAENLAMGNQARNLKDAFIEAFEDSAPNPPSLDEGKGGKARDRALVQETDDFARAKTLYYSQMKRNQSTRSAEGSDYFATPEPIGLTMVRWAGIRANEPVLEPSAGHGAIARWFPELNARTVVEPSYELASKLALVTDAKLVNGSFENFNVVNKFGAVVMNPPFGLGGSLAIPHLAKAAKHLHDGGRIVAIIPEGPAANAKFEKWLYESEDAKGIYLTADIGLPQATFKRAGTEAKTRIVILDKISDKALKAGVRHEQQSRRDIQTDDINELFDRLRDMDVPPRVNIPDPSAGIQTEANQQRAAVSPAAQDGAPMFNPVKGSKSDGGVIFIAVPTGFMGDAFKARALAAKRLGGWWHSYAKKGEKGFAFRTEAARDEFIAKMDPSAVPPADLSDDAGLQMFESALDSSDSSLAARGRKPIDKLYLQTHWNKIKGRFAGRVYFINSLDDVPSEFRKYADWLRARGYEHKWRGGVFERNGQSFVAFNARSFESLADFERTAAHELGHFGMDAMFGSAYQQFADAAYASMGRGAFRDQIITYFGREKADGTIDTSSFDPANPKHRLKVVDELAGELAGSLPKDTKLRAFLDQLYTWIQRTLREAGWRRTFSERELRHIVRGARQLALAGASRTHTPTPTEYSVVELQNLGLAVKQNADNGAARQRKLAKWIGEGRFYDRAFRVQFEVLGLIQMDKHGNYVTSPKARRAAVTAATWLQTQGTRPFSALAGYATKAGSNLYTMFKGKSITLEEAKARNAAMLRQVLETVKHGLVDRYGTPIEYIETEQQRKAENTQALLSMSQTIMPMMNSAMTPEEAKLIYLAGSGQQIDNKDVEKLAAPIVAAIDQMSQDLVALGYLSKEAYERNRLAYLHRIYMKHEERRMQSPVVAWFEEFGNRRRVKLIGAEFKGRGIFKDVDTADLGKAVGPEWWGKRFEGKKIDVALGETKWVMLDRVVNAADGTSQTALLANAPDKAGKVTARVYWPADMPIPQKFAGYENRGTFEVRKVSPGKVTLWRDYTEAERMKMGEIMDGRYVAMRTVMVMANDVATGKLYRDVSLNPNWARKDAPTTADGTPIWVDAESIMRKRGGSFATYSQAEWVKVPESKIAGTSVNRYGALAGMYVRAPIWRDMAQVEAMQMPSFWRGLLTQWKKNKTVWSPKTHMANVLSNLGMMDLADMRARDMLAAIRSFRDGDGDFVDATSHNLFGDQQVEQDIRTKILEPLFKQMTDAAIDESDPSWGYRMFEVLRRVIEKADEKFSNAYQLEDSLFRMAMYMKLRNQGHSPMHAAHMARAQFIDYDIRAPWVNAARATVWPFIGYTYRAVGLLAEATTTRPWKIYKWFITMVLAKELFYAMAGDDDDEQEKTEALLPEDLQGITFLGTQKAVRLPTNDEYGNPNVLDLRNTIPGSNIFGMQGFSQAPWMPAVFVPGGPLVISMELTAFNQSVLTGQPIVDTDQYGAGENLARWSKHAYQAWMPDTPFLPFTRSFDTITGAALGKTNEPGEQYSVGQSLLTAFGIKIRSVNLDVRIDQEKRKFDRLVAAKRARQSDLRRVFSQQTDSRNVMSEKEFKSELERLEAEIADIRREEAEFFKKVAGQ